VMPSQQTMRRNTLAPGAVANPVFAPPLRQRASAPPVGDMAVGTMVLRDPSYLDVRGPRVTLTFKGVPASNAMQALAKIGGYGLVYNSNVTVKKTTSVMRETTAEGPAAIKQNTTEQKNPDPEINASFVYEEYASALNMIISGSGLQAKLVGRTIIVGVEALSSNTGRLASKIYRLNQASAKSAAQYLGSLGATIRTPRTFTTTESAQRDSSGGGGGSQSSTSTSTSAGFIRDY
jgi:type IV pilus assembly protein PilQ